MPDPIALTPQTAPRTAQELCKFTPIELRLLTDNHLAGLRSDKEKMAWFELKTQDAKANYILSLLKRWDENNPGMHTNGATSISTPAAVAPEVVRTPVTASPAPAVPSTTDADILRKWGTMGPPPSQNGAGHAEAAPAAVSPAALASAVAATADKPKRQPRTTNAAATTEPPADLSATVINLLNRLLEGQEAVACSTEKLHAQIMSTLEDAASSKGSRVTALESKYEALESQMQAISDMSNTIMKTQMWALMATLSGQSVTMKTSVIDVLRCAIHDSDDLQAMVKVIMGKA